MKLPIIPSIVLFSLAPVALSAPVTFAGKTLQGLVEVITGIQATKPA